MKNLHTIYNELTSNQVVTVEDFNHYPKSLTKLLLDYYGVKGGNEIFIIMTSSYGTSFYIPNTDVFEQCANEFNEYYKDYEFESEAEEEELFEEWESNFHTLVVTINNLTNK